MRLKGDATHVNVPNTLGDVVRARSGSCLGGISANSLVPFLGLEKPDGAGEQACSNQVEKTS